MTDSVIGSEDKGDIVTRGEPVAVTDDAAERVRHAEEIIRTLLADGALAATDLMTRVAQAVDPSIASLAIWQLLDRGELLFTSRERRLVRRAG